MSSGDAVDDGWEDGDGDGGGEATDDGAAEAAGPAAGGEPGRRKRRRRRRRGGDREPGAPREAQPSQSQRPPQPQRPPQAAAPRPAPAPAPPAPRAAPPPAAVVDDDDEPAPETPSVAWGTDDDGPAPAVALASGWPADAPADDPDPVSFPFADEPGARLGDDVVSAVGVRFVPAGRIQWFDAGEADYAPGERVLVDSDRGSRLAWIATAPIRRAARDRGLRRVIRRAGEQELRGDEDAAERARVLRVAKDAAAALRLPLKVFRVEVTDARPRKLHIYYTSDERLDLRDFVRDVGAATGARLELRQLGVRDEAKAVGGIGSCGLTLCCTTWLPDFVPVSIKMAKDQGLVLSPTKVSGQCGRLKCCLVYEQAGYAELRKGLPKLGKRVISARGEGRVVEVDVLRQRVRVSYGPGDTEVMPAADVKPMFPSGNQPRGHERDPESEPEAELPDPDLPQS